MSVDETHWRWRWRCPTCGHVEAGEGDPTRARRRIAAHEADEMQLRKTRPVS